MPSVIFPEILGYPYVFPVLASILLYPVVGRCHNSPDSRDRTHRIGLKLTNLDSKRLLLQIWMDKKSRTDSFINFEFEHVV